MSNFDNKSEDQKSQDQSQDQKSASRTGRSLVARWRVLAQQRLDHLIELYQSGRWKLYYKEQDFLAMVQEARGALKVWEQLAPPDPVLDKPVEVALAQDALADTTTPQIPGALLHGVAAEHNPRKS